MRKYKKTSRPNIDLKRHNIDGEEFKVNGKVIPRGDYPHQQTIFCEIGDIVETDLSPLMMKNAGFTQLDSEPKPEEKPKTGIVKKPDFKKGKDD